MAGLPKKKLAEEAIRLYNGKRRRKEGGGELLGKIKGGGDPRNARREKRKPVLRMDVRIFRLVCM